VTSAIGRTFVARALTPAKHGRYKEITSFALFAVRTPEFRLPRTCRGPLPCLPKGFPVNKSEMIDAIARHADISKAAAGRALDATVGAIKSSLRQGDIVWLVGFGSFYVGKRSPRAGRNPRTGDAIKIKGGKVPKFRAGKALKDALN
jgi:DNA-binding protein HU-beta